MADHIIAAGGFTVPESETPAVPVGTKVEREGKVYRYVKSAATILQGEVVYPIAYVASTMWSVTNDEATDGGLMVAGVAMVSIQSGYYGWIQVGGVNATIRCATGVLIKEFLHGHTVNGECENISAGDEHLVFGISLAAATTFTDDNGTESLDCVPGYLHNCLWG